MPINLLQPDNEQDIDDPYVQEIPVKEFIEAVEEGSRENNQKEEEE